MKPMPMFLSLLVTAWIGGLWSAPASAQKVEIAGRQVIMLQPAMDLLWGSYLMLAEAEEDGAKLRFRAMLPREKQEFAPRDGISEDELQFDEEQGIVIDKEFKAGTNFMGLGFNTKAESGVATLTFDVEDYVDEIALLAPVGSLEMEGAGVVFEPNVTFSGRSFDTWTIKEFGDGTVIVTVKGIPQGRGMYWLVGGVCGGILLLAGIFLSLRTKPKLVEDNPLAEVAPA